MTGADLKSILRKFEVKPTQAPTFSQVALRAMKPEDLDSSAQALAKRVGG